LNKTSTRDTVFLLVTLLLCAVLQRATYGMREAWPGLPPASEKAAALVYGFGDTQLAYRNIGMMLQNTGDTGGRVTNINDYDYANVAQWMWLSRELDKDANYIPSLAAFYFGAAKDKENLRHLVGYLAEMGDDTRGERWRWMAHAVYWARFVIDDQELALKLAERLAALEAPDMPIWTKQMPAFVMSKVGQKKAARDLLLTIAATDKNVDPAELSQTCWYIDKHLRELDDGLESNEVWRILCKKN
jgi:hypothetical protein